MPSADSRSAGGGFPVTDNPADQLTESPGLNGNGQRSLSADGGRRLAAVLRTAELSRRGSRRADHASENRALTALMQELAGPDGNVLQMLAEAALELCRAHSAGVSILEDEDRRPVFRWRA